MANRLDVEAVPMELHCTACQRPLTASYATIGVEYDRTAAVLRLSGVLKRTERGKLLKV